MLQIVGRMRNNLSTSESDSKPEFWFSFIQLAWITTKGDSGFMKRSNTPVIILVDKIPRRFLDSRRKQSTLTPSQGIPCPRPFLMIQFLSNLECEQNSLQTIFIPTCYACLKKYRNKALKDSHALAQKLNIELWLQHLQKELAFRLP